jgi:hypothetical protein
VILLLTCVDGFRIVRLECSECVSCRHGSHIVESIGVFLTSIMA